MVLFHLIVLMELEAPFHAKKCSGYKARYLEIGKLGNRRASIKNKNISLMAAGESLHDQAGKAIRQSKIKHPSEHIE